MGVRLTKTRKRNKYGAKPCVIDGFRFASQREGLRYATLKQMERAKQISGLECHPRFDLFASTRDGTIVEKIGYYTADFQYRQGEAFVVEDSKVTATKTEAYGLRKRMMAVCHGIDVKEV